MDPDDGVEVMTDLVFIHGAAGRKEELHPLATGLLDHVTCWSLDLLGHNGRRMPEAFGLMEMVQDIVSGLDRCGFDRPYLFGYSFGGYLALLIARLFPDRVAGCCVLATHLVYDVPAIRQSLLILSAQKIQRMEDNWVRDIYVRFRHMLETFESNDLVILQDDLRSIQAPVLVLGGQEDPLVNAHKMQGLAKLLPHHRCVVFPGSAHPITAAPLDVIQSAITNFIADVESRRLQAVASA
jgi:pimeloyl-ACP methyl ester carboxylesterase